MTRELLTNAQAADYCGYRSTSAIRRAVHDGRLVPVGRRGGSGTLMFRRSDLDGFSARGRRDSVSSGRPSTPPMEDADGQNEVDETMEALGQANAPARSLEDEGRRLHRSRKGHRPDQRPAAGTEEGVPPRHGPRRLQLGWRRKPKRFEQGSAWRGLGTSASPTTR